MSAHRDAEFIRVARAAEAQGEALLPGASQVRARFESERTRGPLQDALRTAAQSYPAAARQFDCANAAYWQLVLCYDPWLRGVTRRYCTTAQTFSSGLQEARIGCFDAALRFDTSMGVPFVAYAESYVRNALYRATERQGVVHRRGAGGATVMVAMEDVDESTLGMAMSVEDNVASAQMRARLSVLSPRHQAVLYARACDSTYPAIGREVGVSAERARQLEREARLTLSQVFGQARG